MTLNDYNAFCASLAHTNHVVQWGGADVWKVDVKVFALAREDEDGFKVSFKCSDIAYEVLRETAGCIPAPYLASRGMKWIQWSSDEGIDEAEMLEHLAMSHRLASLNLTKKRQKALGLNQIATDELG